MIGTIPLAQSKKVSGGHSPVISSNGASNGVLWQLNGKDLCAFNATTLVELYKSSKAHNHQDALPKLPHFADIMVNNGKAYIGTYNSLFVYGLVQ